MSTYTTDARGELGGLVGWTRILRNGEVVHYCPTQADADAWIAAPTTSTAYIERAQEFASEHAAFKAASFREQADVLELIREHWSEMKRDGFTAAQAANVALLQVLPMPWCERCDSYHHESAPHIRESS